MADIRPMSLASIMAIVLRGMDIIARSMISPKHCSSRKYARTGLIKEGDALVRLRRRETGNPD